MKRRLHSGSSFVELAAGLIFLVPLVLYGIDAGCLYIGQSMNEDYCREACRAAGNGPPAAFAGATGYTPTARAQQTLRIRYRKTGMVQINPDDAVVSEQVFDPKPSAPFGGPVNGVVSVKTKARVLPPLPLPWMPQEIFLQTQQTFPFTWNMPGTFSLSNGAAAGGGGGNGGSSAGANGGSSAGNPGGQNNGSSSGSDLNGNGTGGTAAIQ